MASPAWAQSQDSCAASGGQFCNLGKYLHGLYAIAALLAVILIVVLVATLAYFRRARNMQIEP